MNERQWLQDFVARDPELAEADVRQALGEPDAVIVRGLVYVGSRRISRSMLYQLVTWLRVLQASRLKGLPRVTVGDLSRPSSWIHRWRT
jgi:hypothetical protein